MNEIENMQSSDASDVASETLSSSDSTAQEANAFPQSIMSTTAHGDPRTLLETLPPNTRLVELSPAIATRSGQIPRSLIPSSCVSAVLSNAPTWEQLAESSLGGIQNWQGVGMGRAAHVVAFAISISTMASPTLVSSPVIPDQAAANLLRAIELVAGWALVKGVERGLSDALKSAESEDAPPSVQSAMEFLRDIDLQKLSNKVDLIEFDPLQAAAELLSEFEGNDSLLLDRLLARGIRPVSTLEEIGQVLNVTRERVRQLEVQVSNRLSHMLIADKYSAIRRHAAALSRKLGSAFPVSRLPTEMTPTVDGSLVDELFAYLAGPFVQCDGWFVRKGVAGSLDTLVETAFDSASNGVVAPLDALTDALEAAGVLPELVGDVIASTPRYRVIGESVVIWGGIREKIISVLHAMGRPMTLDEIQAAVIVDESPSSVRNVLASSPLVKRTKKNEWSLASWEGAEYRGILDHIREELTGTSLSIAELAARLGEKFEISSTSVTMYASMHPVFVNEDGLVRLRREDEPYIPTASLEMTADCYQIDGSWSVAYTVDKDLMRGSGRVMPEAFAIHIGLQPGGQGSLQSNDRVVNVGWGMNPFFGSLRWVVEREGLVLGDRLFVIRSKPSELKFRFVRVHEMDAASTPIEKLQLSVGATGSTMPMERWLGDALGLGGATTPTVTQLKARLLARNEPSQAALLDHISNSLEG